nr:6222_t:CDS:10 [Entrophospora candida]
MTDMMYSGIHDFQDTYRCYPVDDKRLNVYYGGKTLAKLSSLHIVYPMLFRLHNKKINKHSHAGVLEFIAPEGHVYLPQWLMETLSLETGDLVDIKNATLPLGKFVKIQPQTENFLDITDQKAVLENAFRNFSTLTQEDYIQIYYNRKTYKIKVLEVKSEDGKANGISILETDLEVDFAPPPGYKEKKESQQKNSTMVDKLKIEQSQDESRGFSAFQGSGQNLKGTKVSNVQQNESDNAPAPLRMPFGKLFFGYKVVPFKSSKDKITEEPVLKFPGEEDMPIHVYEGYLTTHSKTFSSILPLPPNISSTTSQRNHDKKGSHVRLHLVTMEV